MLPSGHLGDPHQQTTDDFLRAGHSKPEEDLAIPANEAQVVTSMRTIEETKRINLGFADERKTAIINSSLDDK
jgi:hypothetical protein